METRANTPTNVLVVDDDAGVRETYQDLLSAAGYTVATAADGRAALEYLRGHSPPGVVLVDMDMPLMDGRQLRLAMLAEPSLADIPVVLHSGTPHETMPIAAALGVEFLAKPTTLGQLLGTLARHCGRPPADGTAGT